MDNTNRKTFITDEEEDIIIAYVHEIEKDNFYIGHCPRCGKKLSYKQFESGYEVKCEDSSCIDYSVRGI